MSEEAKGAPRQPPTLAGDLYKSLQTSVDLVKQFKKEFGRAPSEIELRLTASLFIEMQRSQGRRRLRKVQGRGKETES